MTSLKASKLIVAIVIANFMLECYSQDLGKIPEIEQYKLHCIEWSQITESSAKKLRDEEEPANPTQSMKCYVQCFFQKLRFMNEKSELQKDKIVGFLSKAMEEAKAKSLYEKCLARRTNPCDTAYDMFICYRKNKAKLF
ncbi:general odorant-binding protein 56a-like [Uranotaenia lowii]|uniref:general odorant-binding protein 56a-like n=1 Tax=Uranotaenia lowii TaxID=190385 RepID=UPI002479CC18|nr:general odorant-binding protein 56a-like [Uranotaenia lowii]